MAAKDPPLVIVTEPLDPDALDWLCSRAAVARAAPDDDAFGPLLAEAQGLVVRTYTRVDRRLLDAAPRLRVVGRGGVGLDNIDLAACAARGVRVVHTPEANTQAVVEYVLALLLDALRPRAALARAVDAASWNRLRAEVFAERQLDELALGILGLGRIGRRVAEVASAVGMRTCFHDLREVPPAERGGAAPVELATLLSESDVLSVHVDGRPANRHLLDAGALALLRPRAVLINTSRGFVIDDRALAAFLTAHPGALALLDVHDPEPVAPENPLLGLPNAHLFPHLASRTATALRNMSWVVRDVVAVLEGSSPRWEAPSLPSDPWPS